MGLSAQFEEVGVVGLEGTGGWCFREVVRFSGFKILAADGCRLLEADDCVFEMNGILVQTHIEDAVSFISHS